MYIVAGNDRRITKAESLKSLCYRAKKDPGHKFLVVTKQPEIYNDLLSLAKKHNIETSLSIFYGMSEALKNTRLKRKDTYSEVILTYFSFLDRHAVQHLKEIIATIGDFEKAFEAPVRAHIWTPDVDACGFYTAARVAGLKEQDYDFEDLDANSIEQLRNILNGDFR